MSIDAIGFATMTTGLAVLMLGPVFALWALLMSTLLGAASALTIGDPSRGSSIQPAYILLGFCLLDLLRRDRSRGLLVRALAWGQPGFWLLATVVYGAASAAILPRLFEGQAYVFTVVRVDSGLGLTLRPLTPVSGNVTQSIYLFGDVVAFAIGTAAAAMPRRLRVLVAGVIACTIADLAFGAIDLAAFRMGLGDVLGALRNANYRMLSDGELVGFKRIVGSFPEASAYAYMTLGLFVFSLRLWISGLHARWTGPLWVACAAAIVLTTSTSGYVGLIAGGGLAYAHCLIRAAHGRGTRAVTRVIVLFPIFGVLSLFVLAFSEAARQSLLQLGEATVLNKISTQSGIERGMWNAQAVEVFFATSGLGAGVGSVRASSSVIASLANLGIIGTVLYCRFLLDALSRRDVPFGDRYRTSVQGAARAACIALLASAAVSGGGVDLGLVFFLFAGVGSSRLLASCRGVGSATGLHTSGRPNPGSRPAPCGGA